MKKLQVTRFWQIQARIAGNRFDDNSGDLLLIRRKHSRDCFGVVKGQDDRVLRKSGGHTRAVRVAESQRSRAGLDQQRVGMTVIAAIEFDDLIALSETTCQTDRGHSRFRARVAHPHLFDAGNHGANQFGHGHLKRIGNAETDPVGGGCLHRLNNLSMCVTKDGRAPGSYIIHVFIAVDVPDPGALGLIDKERLTANGAKRPDRRIDPAGNVFQGLCKKLFGFGPRDHGKPPSPGAHALGL